MDDYEEAVLFTFAELESRLDRLEYLLSGPKEQTEEKPKTIPDRMHRIEKVLQELAGRTSLLNDARELLAKHKDVLEPQPDNDGQVPNPLDVSQKAILVTERATSFATTASQLKALDDQQLPTTDGFAKLSMLRPRIAEFEDRHLQQALKIAELRRRTGLVNEKYKRIHFIGAATVWVDYHQRLTKALNELSREEYKRRPEEEAEEY